MIKIQNIAVPVDFSENSRKAALYAAEFARERNARLHLLYFEDKPEELEQRTIELGSRAIELLKAFNRLAGSPVAPDPPSSSDASGLSFYIAAHEGFTVEERQELLEMPTPSSRIEREVELLKNKIDLLAAQEAIRKIAGGNGKMRNDLNLHDPPLLQS
jgi:nucleotide-binding universal stress UspA family protein